MHRDFWFNSDLGKTHKGKTSEKENFYYFRAQRNLLLQQKFYSKNFTNLSQKNLAKSPSEQPPNQLLDFCARNPYHCTIVTTINAVWIV
jgi:hypothetical protein